MQYKIDPIRNTNNITLANDENSVIMYPIPGIVDIYPNTYILTSNGKVFSFVDYGKNHEPKEIKPWDSNGYLYVGLKGYTRNRSMFRLNRLVMIYFNPVPGMEFLEVDHLNNNRHDNRLCNLAWKTHREHMEDHSIRNEDTEKIQNIVKDLKDAINTGLTIEQIAIKNNSTVNEVSKIKQGFTHRGTVKESKEDFHIESFLTPELIIMIYERAKAGISDEQLAREFRRNIATIQAIRRADYPYNLTLGPDRPGIIFEKGAKLDKETALSMYNDLENGMSIKDATIKYNVGDCLVSDVKYCRGSYKFLATEYDKSPIESVKVVPDHIALEINRRSKTEMNVVLCKDYNLSDSTVADIKYCRGAYARLTTIGGTPFKTDKQLPPPKFNKEEAEAIRKDALETRFSETMLSKKWETSRKTIHAILYAEGQYSYFETDYLGNEVKRYE